MRLPLSVRYALRATAAVESVILILIVVRAGITPDAWHALGRQLHLPERVGTLDLDTFLDDMRLLFYVSIAVLIVWRVGRWAASPDRGILSGLSESLEEGVESLYRRSRWGRPVIERRARDWLNRLFEEEPRLSTFITADQREQVVQATLDATSASIEYEFWRDATWDRIAIRQMTQASEELNQRIVTVHNWHTGFTYAHALVVEQLGGAFHRSDLCNGYIMWNEPVTPYSIGRLRLYLAAVDLVMCEEAGERADALHDRLAAESRLWSYKGYRVAGEAGTTPEAIERAAVVEVQQIVAAAMLASTPEVVVGR